MGLYFSPNMDWIDLQSVK
uniref:CSON006901 protein n=1 Tax=Culicoides sonorensis TaxID=179676 RepID=A0A336LX51_CULSO